MSRIALGCRNRLYLRTLIGNRLIPEGYGKVLYNKQIISYLPFAITYFVDSGRSALLLAAKALGLKEGDEIIAPSYYGEGAIVSFERLGIKVVLARVNFVEKAKQMSIGLDLYDVKKNICENTKAILLIHYFGFANATLIGIKELCRKNNIALIEDCAQVLFSKYQDKLLGSFGDVSIFSLEKTMPLPNGGVLCINPKSSLIISREEIDWHHKKLIESKFASKVCLQLLHTVIRLLPLLCRGSGIIPLKLLSVLGKTAYYNLRTPLTRRGIVKISFITRKIINSVDVEKLSEYNKMRYNIFWNEVKRTNNVTLGEINNEITPTSFVVFLRSNKDRDELKMMLIRKNIFASIFWTQDVMGKTSKTAFPETIDIRDRMLAFPLEYFTTINEIKAIANLIRKEVDIVSP